MELTPKFKMKTKKEVFINQIIKNMYEGTDLLCENLNDLDIDLILINEEINRIRTDLSSKLDSIEIEEYVLIKFNQYDNKSYSKWAFISNKMIEYRIDVNIFLKLKPNENKMSYKIICKVKKNQ